MENLMTLNEKLELITKLVDGTGTEQDKEAYDIITEQVAYDGSKTLLQFYELDENQKENLKMISKLVNGNASEEEEKEFSNKFFNKQPYEFTKSGEKQTIEQSVNKKLKNNSGGVFLKKGMEVEYCEMQNRYFASKKLKEEARSEKFRNNKKEAEKYNFVDEKDYREGGKYYDNEKKKAKKMPKQTDAQYMEWADKASVKVNTLGWEREIDSAMLKNVITDLKILN